MLQYDEMLFRWINGMAGHAEWDHFFYFLTLIGWGGAIWVALALVLLLGAGRLPGLRPRSRAAAWRKLGLVILVALVLSWGTESGLKRLTARPRPAFAVAGAKVLGSLPASYSFPSGHALSSFAAASALQTALSRLSRRGRVAATPADGWCAWLLAALISFSRIWVGHHYPLDVLAGAALGTAVGWLTAACLVSYRH